MNKIKEEVLESLNAWHSDKIRGNKVYFADAVEGALDETLAEVENGFVKELKEELRATEKHDWRLKIINKLVKKYFAKELKDGEKEVNKNG